MASTFVLTSVPLQPSQVPLGSFVPNIKQPYADVKHLVSLQRSDYSVLPDLDFSSIVKTSSESLLQILATRFADLLVRRGQGSSFQVEADRGFVYTLDNPKDLFTAILASEAHGDTAKRWLEDCKLSGLAPRFVVGHRTFVDAKLSRSKTASHDIHAEVAAPVGNILGDVSGLGLADVKAGAGHKSSHVVEGKSTMTGERVYAIAYRKIRVKIRKGIISGTLDLKDSWEPFSGMRGEDSEEDEDRYFQADASDADDGDDCKMVLVPSKAGENDEPVRLAFFES